MFAGPEPPDAESEGELAAAPQLTEIPNQNEFVCGACPQILPSLPIPTMPCLEWRNQKEPRCRMPVVHGHSQLAGYGPAS
jgi:hypothetical protein